MSTNFHPFDTNTVYEAIERLNAAGKSTNASQVQSVTGLSRRRLLTATDRLRAAGLIKDVGKGNAYNWRTVEAQPVLEELERERAAEGSQRVLDSEAAAEAEFAHLIPDTITVVEAFGELAAKAWETHPNNPDNPEGNWRYANGDVEVALALNGDVESQTTENGDVLVPRAFRVATVAFGSDNSSNVIQLAKRVAQYLPSNYETRTLGSTLLIVGHDSAGWTLQTYVIPRLASGLITAYEITGVEA